MYNLRPLVLWAFRLLVFTPLMTIPVFGAEQDGGLRMEIMAAPNLVVVSNVESQPQRSPTSAHFGVRICNDGAGPITNITVHIGDLIDEGAFTGTPGVYPAKTQAPYVGTFSFTHEGPASDATRLIPRLEAGECLMQYWLISYPILDDNGDSVTGGVKPGDDLFLNYDIWASGEEAGVERKVFQTETATMRSEISAMANKIWPNGTNKVPDEYLDAIEEVLGWRPDPGIELGDAFEVEGIWYDLGNVGQGFDNDGDLVPDRNLWMQPVGNPSLYDPTCFRLVKTYGIVIVKLKTGDLLIPFEDQLYFSNIPDKNNGAVGLVFYEFVAIGANCASQLSPYQEVASGRDNEKFNGDYGTGPGSMGSGPAPVSFDKTVDLASLPQPLPGALSYTLTAVNQSPDSPFGQVSLGLPVVFNDSIPPGTEYVAGSAATTVAPAGVNVNILYSHDNGASFGASEAPAAAVTDIQWWLDADLPASETITVTFDVTVPVAYTNILVSNTGSISLGTASPMLEDTEVTLVEGINSVSGTVFEDDGAGANFFNGVQDADAEETGLAGAMVSLYFDNEGDGTGDLLLATVTSDPATGSYSFTNLPDGAYVVVIDPDITSLDCDGSGNCNGWLPTADTALPVDLDSAGTDPNPVASSGNDVGFAPPLSVTKSLVGGSPALEGQTVTYTIDISNSGPSLAGAPCNETIWGTAVALPQSDGRWNNEINATGAGGPDNGYADTDIGTAEQQIAVTGFDASGISGNITSVEVLYSIYLNGSLGNDDGEARLFFNDDVNPIATLPLSTATLNAYGPTVANKGLLTWDVTAVRTWTTADFAGNLDVSLIGFKNGGPDGAVLNLDAVGFRIVTDGLCGGGDPSGLIVDLPLTDTYNADLLQFVSANPPVSSMASTTTPYTNTGVLSWDNVGPLDGQQTKTVTVVFEGLEPPGNLTAAVTNEAAVTGASNGSGESINDAAGQVTHLLEPTGSLAGRVWSDGNANGWQGIEGYEAGEDGVPGVTVILHSCDDLGGGGTCNNPEVITTTVTDANGDYQFTGLQSNLHYYVEIDPATLPGSLTAQTGDPDDDGVNSGDGGTCDATCDDIWDNGGAWFQMGVDTWGGDMWDPGTLSFGYAVPPAAFGTLWHDLDGNGVFDTGEPPLTNVTVNVTGVTSTLAVTGADGRYVLEDLNPGAHTISVDTNTLPAGTTWVQTAPAGDIAITVAAGEISGSHDFGFFCTGTLTVGGTLFVDVDGDGIQGATDPALQNVDVLLYRDVDGNGLLDPAVDYLLTNTTSSVTGNYAFSGLPNGEYLVQVDQSDPDLPDGYSQSADPDEPGRCSDCDGVSTVSLAGVSDTGQHFGFLPQGAGSIGDLVFVDSNGDGLVGVGEVGISNITVTLVADLDGNGSYETTLATTTSGSDGTYLFENLPDGDYQVVVDTVDPDLPVDGNGDGFLNSTTNAYEITLSGASGLDADFGFAGLAAIGDFVFFDDNGNGIQDFTEGGISNVTVSLYADTNNDGLPDGPALQTTVTADGSGTDEAGFYTFTGVYPGQYVVVVDDATLPTSGGSPIPMTSDPDRDGVACDDDSFGVPPAIAACDNSDSYIIVGFNGVYGGANFGYQPSGVIGDFVWLDTNGDGIQDPGEPGIAGVTVEITDGTNTFSVLTDPDGRYTFSGLDDGAWTVTIPASNFGAGQPLENFGPSGDADGVPDSSTLVYIVNGSVTQDGGDANPANDNPWCPPATDCSLELDFGYALAGSYSISGGVCLNDARIIGTCDDVDDFADDGVDRDAGADDETELGGRLLYLYEGSGNFLGSTVTADDGSYSFSNLPAGDYQLVLDSATFPLDQASLTTTDANNAAVTNVIDNGTSVILQFSISTANVTDLDYAFISTVEYDYGDLPDSYGITTINQNGARHVIPGGGSTYFLGTAPDVDINGAPAAHADGDDSLSADDEDGVIPISVGTWSDGAVTNANGGAVQVDATVPAGASGWLVGWIDFNNDGDLTDPGELVISEAVTNSGSKGYSFDIPAGTITGTSQSFLSRFRLSPDEPPFPLFSYSGEVIDGEVEDHFIQKPVGGTLSDLVWNDTNGDGVFDANEEGLGGVTVTLGGDAASAVVTSDGTVDVDGDGLVDPLGFYAFTGLAAGDYTVTVTPPAGFSASYDEDSGTISPDNTTAITLIADEQHDTADFGLAPLFASVSGFVLEDGGDASFSGDDTPLGGITVQLWTDPNGDGDLSDGLQVGEATSDPGTGAYSFTNVASGTYVVLEVDPSGIFSVADTDGANDNQVQVSLSGVDSTGNNFLDFVDPAFLNSISGTVVLDENGDGFLNLTETNGVSGATVELQDTLGNVLAITTTDPDGNYAFPGLSDGDYVVVEIDPAGQVSTGDADGGDPNRVAVTVAGANESGAYFLDVEGGTVSGSVLDDTGDDNTLDGLGETPIPGVIVELWQDTTGDGNLDTLVATTTTDSNGEYTFTDVLPGDYSVIETDPAGATSDTPNEVAVTLVPGGDENVSFLDDVDPASLHDISGTVFQDENGDGVLGANETNGVSGVIIELQDTLGNVMATTTTDPDGNYAFPGLPDGDYVVVETDPAGQVSTGDADGGDLNRVAVTLAGADESGAYFLDVEGGTVSGSVLDDTGDDNTLDGLGETPIPGVTVELWQDTTGDGNLDTLVATTTTDANGEYTFTDVLPGDYSVIETDPAGATSDTPNEVAVTLVPGGDETVSFLDDVDPALLHDITGTVFLDENGDGVLDANETNGVSGVIIELQDASGNVLATTTTDPAGNYAFPGLPDGDYVVVETDPAGQVSTGDADGGDPNRVAVTLAGADESGAYFLDVEGGTVSGSVLDDTGDDNTLDGLGETPIPGVTVELWQDANGDGLLDVLVATTTTDANGDYTFTDVLPGEYTVVETDPAGATSDTPNEVTVTLAPGGDENASFLDDVDPASLYDISGTVFQDENGDGVLDANETNGVSGVIIELQDSAGNVIATTTTDPDGNYAFPGLPDGDYVVVETDPAGQVSTGDADGGDPNRVAITLAGADESGAYFLDVEGGTVSGSVLDDTGDDNTLNGVGETPIPGVTVELWQDANGDGLLDVLVATTTTDANGEYGFTDVLPGEYIVVETDPAGATSDTPNEVTVTLAPGGDENASFLDDVDPASLYDISGTVFQDENGDGVLDANETNGVSGVIIELQDASGNVLATTTTDPDGNYAFPGLPDGDYVVVETDPAGQVSTGDADGGDPNRVAITLAGADESGAYFLDVEGATVSGSVLDDTGDDDTLNGVGETPIPGVTVELWQDANGDGLLDVLVATTTTDANGEYGFTDVLPGEYTVVETDPAGATSDTPNEVAVTLVPGGDENVSFLDDVDPASLHDITGTVFQDENGDGVLGANETNGVSGVIIELQDTLGNVIATTTTDPDGNYAFPGLPDGDYVVVETDPAGQVSTGDADGGDPNRVAITLAGADESGAYFLDVEGATVRGSVLDDTGDDDTLNGVGETPIPGVTVELWQDTNGDGLLDGLVATTATDANGEYAFTDVPPGNYTVVETDPAGATSDTPNEVAVTLVPGGDENVSFLDDVDPASLHDITGTVFQDENGDGVLGANETNGVSGVIIELQDTLGNVIATTTTDPDGNYAFPGLPDGDYVVVETDPAGQVSTGDADGGDLNRVAVTLAGADESGAYFLDVEGGTVSGSVLDDTGDDNTLDGLGETPIPGVTVELWQDTTGDGNLDTLVATTTTDSNGEYTFTDVLPGDYSVIETDPAGATSDTPNEVAVTLVPGGDENVSFLDDVDPALLHDITGTVFQDENGDGVLDANETNGVSGVIIELQDASGNVLATTTTDPAGNYAFPGLPDGDYVVVEIDPAGQVSTGDADGGDPNRVAVTLAGADESGAYFLDVEGGTVSGSVLDDTGDDNTLDGLGETPIPGVTVELWQDANGDGLLDSLVATTATDANGDYTFTDVPPGNYTVVETDPAGATSDTPNEVAVTLVPGGDETTSFLDDLDPAFLNDISGTVLLDENGDGVLGANETNGVSGVIIELQDSAGNVIATTTTDPDGNYAFPGLPDGDYVVVETDPAGQVSTGDADGGDPNRVAITLAGADESGAYFLDVEGATVSGSVLDDTSDDNTLDGLGETPIPGVTVELWQDTTGDGNLDTLVATTTTDSNGEYTFTDVLPGDYSVIETDPAGATSDTPNEVAVTLVPGGDENVSFLDDVDPASLHDITGTVFQDENGDGVLGANETNGVSGVIIELQDSAGNVIATTTTDPDGNYAFPGLPNGDYVIVETDPAGQVSTGDADGGDPNRVAITLAGADESGAYFLDVEGGTVSGSVLDDTGDDNTLDGLGETPIPGVTVELWQDTNGDGLLDVLVATTTTDANGEYGFTDVLPGEYTVVETDPAGATSDTPNEVTVTLAPGGDENASFLDDVDPASLYDISGTVFQDENGDGVLDANETNGVSGVIIELQDSAGNVIATTTTDPDGNYAFPGLPDGDYVVVETDPAGQVSTGDADGGDPNRVAVTLAGADESGAYFLNVESGIISGSVLDDTDNDDMIDGGEPGVPGVTVELWQDTDGDGLLDSLVATTTTDINGIYTFNDIFPGEYTVVETDPVGATSDTPNEVAVTLSSGGDETADFLDDLDPAFMKNISGTVVLDENSDGVLDLTETNGISGVTIELQDTLGAVIATTTTDADGNYVFSGLPYGDYVVVETDLAGLTSTGDVDGGDPNRVAVTLAGADEVGVSFLDWGLISIGNRVFNDIGNDGVQDIGDPGIAGVGVSLYEVTGGVSNLVATTHSDSNGYYLFDGLLPDLTYLIVVNVADVDSMFPVPTTPTSYTITPMAGEANLLVIFGFTQAPTAITLMWFEALDVDGSVLIRWETGSEQDNLGFYVYRSRTEDGSREKVNPVLIFGQGTGTGKAYELLDVGASDGPWYYWLEDVEFDFDATLHGPVFVQVGHGEIIGTFNLSESGVYAAEVDDAEHTTVRIDGFEVASLSGYGELIFYVPAGEVRVELVRDEDPMRMQVVNALPQPGLEVKVVVAAEERSTWFNTGDDLNNYFVSGFNTKPVLLDINDPLEPKLLNSTVFEMPDQTSLYMSYGIRKRLIASELDE